jgi:hypothetical protein
MKLAIFSLITERHEAHDWLEKQIPGLPVVYLNSLEYNRNSRLPEGVSHILTTDDASRVHFTDARPLDIGWVHERDGRMVTHSYDPTAAFSFSNPYADMDSFADLAFKDTTSTQHKNHMFWLWSDLQKLVNPLDVPPPKWAVVYYPSAQVIIARLIQAIRDREELVVDIETHPASNTLNCIGIGFTNTRDVYVVPVYRYNDRLAYDITNMLRILALYGTALQTCPLVLHNAMFDLLFTALFYRIPFGANNPIYDTMLVHHAMYSQVEKSLGHVIRKNLNERYHKDQNITSTHNDHQDRLLWQYNALDVIRTAQCAWVQRKELPPKAQEAGKELCDTICPYAYATLYGMAIDPTRVTEGSASLTLRAENMKRILRLLMGKPDFNPNSTPQLKNYFFKDLLYTPVSKTDKGAPTLGKKELYALALKYPNNPIFPVILTYREAITASRFFQFLPPMPVWKYDLNDVSLMNRLAELSVINED